MFSQLNCEKLSQTRNKKLITLEWYYLVMWVYLNKIIVNITLVSSKKGLWRFQRSAYGDTLLKKKNWLLSSLKLLKVTIKKAVKSRVKKGRLISGVCFKPKRDIRESSELLLLGVKMFDKWTMQEHNGEHQGELCI